MIAHIVELDYEADGKVGGQENDVGGPRVLDIDRRRIETWVQGLS